MSFDVVTTKFPEYLLITNTGEFSLPALFEFIERVKREADAAGRSRVLVDSRAITGDLNDVDRFMGGQKSAEVFGSKIKLALMMPAKKITKMAELAAVNRGAKVLVTDSETEALAWLLK